MKKVCICCKENKSVFEFSFLKRENRYTSRCKKCRCIQAKQWRVKNPDKAKAIADRARPKQKEYYSDGRGKKQSRKGLLSKYGISDTEYNEILKSQNDVCAICFKKETRNRTKNLSIDHCHKTGKVRGLLCAKCNSALGHFEDNIENMKNAINYLNLYIP